MTDKPKAENDNRTAGSVKPDACLHCAIAAAVNKWAEFHAPDSSPDGMMVLKHLGILVAELIGQAPERVHVDLLGHFTTQIARRLRIPVIAVGADVAEPVDAPPIAPDTKH